MQGCALEIEDDAKMKAMHKRVPMHFRQHDRHMGGRNQRTTWERMPIVMPNERAEAEAEEMKGDE